MKRARRRRAVRNGLLAAFFTVVLLEIALRVFPGTVLFIPDPGASDESLFWRHSNELGWAISPNSSGHFSNGGFDGLVTTDEYGIRRNSVEGTVQSDYENIIFIGDSTVASLEVDDDETVPALLERQLRAQGRRVNVINLGVRGYGTDQAVLSALLHAPRLRPTQVLYMYVGNDIYENNTVKRPNRQYGKGVFIRKEGTTSFAPLGFPVPERARSYGSLVVFDEACRPVVHSFDRVDDSRDGSGRNSSLRIKGALVRALYTLRALWFAREQLARRHAPEAAPLDPHELITTQGVDWTYDFARAYDETGALRTRCSRYFEDQITFLMDQLRTIDTVETVHPVLFPNVPTMELLRQRGRSPDSDYFARLLANGAIDSYTNLSQSMLEAKVSVGDFQCLGDPHFCAEGNAWIADQILRSMTPGPRSRSR